MPPLGHMDGLVLDCGNLIVLTEGNTDILSLNKLS